MFPQQLHNPWKQKYIYMRAGMGDKKSEPVPMNIRPTVKF
jgi:hypothetical protein